MSLVKISGNATGTGIFTIASPNGNTDRTLTLPDNTGTILTTGTAGVPVNGPAFSAYNTSYQTLANTTYTKIAYNTEEFDTGSCYDTTNYRFTPNVAGYYQLNAIIGFTANATGAVFLRLYKNGSAFKDGIYVPNANTGPELVCSWLAYANGSTDYFEIYGWQSSGGNLSAGSGSSFMTFSASMVRGA
jgi:hypothetical protein